MNALLKECLGYKNHQWGLFNVKVKEVVKQQQHEVEKATIGHGEYQLQPQYSFLATMKEKWLLQIAKKCLVFVVILQHLLQSVVPQVLNLVHAIVIL